MILNLNILDVKSAFSTFAFSIQVKSNPQIEMLIKNVNVTQNFQTEVSKKFRVRILTKMLQLDAVFFSPAFIFF